MKWRKKMTIAAMLKGVTLVTAITFSLTASAQTTPTPTEIKAVSEEAFLYGLPMVMMYGIMNEYAINKDSSQYKAPFNTIANVPKVFTPADTAIITPMATHHIPGSGWIFAPSP
ncbi:MAG: hypothetical protein IPJ48_13210 [Propionivibrio sp.]|uniref:Uncharacterized protein n=1 Tax=Candidatus Propionivibrio dominans TaxID=2954373 RepID=A0A9D7FGT2_9RHOO|nr:hypothetical protein [Candidatus Propionivibrio dominans]